MKTFTLALLLGIATTSFAQDYYDTTGRTMLLEQIYDRNVVYPISNLRIFDHEQNMAIFEPSPSGLQLFRHSERQSILATTMAVGGAAATVSGFARLIVGTLSRTPRMANQGGIMFFVGLTTMLGSIAPNYHSDNNFEKAIWLRNKDVLIAQMPEIYRQNLHKIYDSQTIYLSGNQFYIRTPNNLRYSLRLSNTRMLFETSEQSLMLYDEYRKMTKKASNILFVGFLVSLVGLPAVGIVVSLALLPLKIKASKKLREAVMVRNRDVLLKSFR